MNKYFIYFTFAFLTVGFNATAEDLSNVAKCMETKTTNAEWAECNWKEVKLQEAVLQKTWDELDKNYWNRDVGYQALQQDQKQWWKYKESACEAYKIDFGREGQVLNYPACKAAIISQRIEYLRSLLTSITPDSAPHL